MQLSKMTLQGYIKDAAQREALASLIKNGHPPGELSIIIVITGGADDTRRVLSEAITSAIAKFAIHEREEHHENDMDSQVVYFCQSGGIYAGTRGSILVSASCQKHICSEECLSFMKSKGHPVIYIDCGVMQTETERLEAEMKTAARQN